MIGSLRKLMLKQLSRLAINLSTLTFAQMSVSIIAKDLVKRYRQRTVVNHVSIEVKQGEIVGLLGPNGAGKTTTFYQVVGLIKPDEGNVYLDDTNITRLPMYKRAKMGIGYLPQEPSVFRKLSVENNILAVLEMTDMNRDERHQKLETLISEFRLQHVRKSNGDVVSGGERRRTEIARALATDPKFILLDEPFAGIDPIAVEDIQAIVARMKYKNIGILITDHNVTETLSICDRAYLLIEGKIFKHGTAEELAADDDVRRLYLGRNFELRRKDYLHEEARGENSEEMNKKTIIYLKDYILLVDQILAEPDPTSLIHERNFFSYSNELIEVMSTFAIRKGFPKVNSYLQEINTDKLYSLLNPMYVEDIVLPPEVAGLRHLNDIDNFKNQLREYRGLLEKSKLIIENTEWAKYLS